MIRDVAALDLKGSHAQLGDLTTRAREDRLTPADVRGGTFTISNHGVSGSLLAAPIVINQPQTAILGVGRLERRPGSVDHRRRRTHRGAVALLHHADDRSSRDGWAPGQPVHGRTGAPAVDLVRCRRLSRSLERADRPPPGSTSLSREASRTRFRRHASAASAIRTKNSVLRIPRRYRRGLRTPASQR